MEVIWVWPKPAEAMLDRSPESQPALPAFSLDGPDGLPQVSARSTGLEFHPLPSSVVYQVYMWTLQSCVCCDMPDDLPGNISVKLWEKFPGLGWHHLWFWIAVLQAVSRENRIVIFTCSVISAMPVVELFQNVKKFNHNESWPFVYCIDMHGG